MSWPSDGKPRFAVTSVTGPIIKQMASSYASGFRPSPTAFYVVDRAFCHRIVASFSSHLVAADERLRKEAKQECARLNRQWKSKNGGKT